MGNRHECKLRGVLAGDPGRRGRERPCVPRRDRAGCLLSTVHAAPALACGRAMAPGEVEPATVEASRLAAALSSWCWGWRDPGEHTTLTPRENCSPLRALGVRPKGRDSLTYPSTCTRDPDPRVRTWENNSRPASASPLALPQSPWVPTGPSLGPGWGARGRHLPTGPGGWSR